MVKKAWHDETTANELSFDKGFRPQAYFRGGAPPTTFDGVPGIEWLVTATKMHELDAAEARELERDEQLFRSWRAGLRLRQQVGEARCPPIEYQDFRVAGSRVHFRISSLPHGVEIEQPRMVRSDQGVLLSGLIEEIADESVTLWVEKSIPPELPRRGRLCIDDRASRTALDRQRAALDVVQYRRALRPDLRDLLVSPAKVAPATPEADAEWVTADLDEDKKDAVSKALGAPDVMVVQGPPGTGKTVLITELVAQLLRRDPECRILLTSQTHVALDNVLERIHKIRPEARLLRVAQRDDPRVSPAVADLRIDKVAQRWRADVARASERFLDEQARILGVKRENVDIGIAAGRLRVEWRELERLQEELTKLEQAIDAAGQRREEARAAKTADAFQETSELLDQLREDERDLRDAIKAAGARKREVARRLASLGQIGAELAGATMDDLAEWEEGLLMASEAERSFYQLVRLSEEWQLRFGESKEFSAAMIADASVVAGTCLGFAGVPGMNAAEFDVCIVDEASKATPTELLVPLSRAKRWVLVGDTKQLPPFVEDLLDQTSLLQEHELDREALQTTLLDRFVASLPSQCVATLRTQHRMTRAIGDLVSECFYDRDLVSPRDEFDVRLRTILPAPVAWLSTSHLENRHELEKGGSFRNVLEARVVKSWLKRLNFIATTIGIRLRVGVISGYSGQVAELARAVAEIEGEARALQLEVNTVDAFQGREVDICVYSVTRSNPRRSVGFLRDARRVNVALSRGRQGLVIVGDYEFCLHAQQDSPLATVGQYVDEHRGDCALLEATP